MTEFINLKSFADDKSNSIINLFCIEYIREEMLNAKIIFNDNIAKSTCNCYLEQFLENKSHQKSIAKCKLEAIEKFKLQSINQQMF